MLRAETNNTILFLNDCSANGFYELDAVERFVCVHHRTRALSEVMVAASEKWNSARRRN
jgi:hypothetical protein